ncbi:MAG: DUF904 domain-containing protein [Desulfurivibrio sp.]|nr:DUF904 domain-containing protein [Desulfurivibrio sp.]
MEQDESLNRLENIINKLMGNLDAVAAEKDKLAGQLQRTNQENEELQQELTRLRQEKEQVRERVGGLIETVEQWERNFAATTGAQAPTESE